MNVFSAIVAASTPTLIYTLIIWWLDRYEKEPIPLLIAAFAWGSLPAVVIAFYFQFVLALPVSQTPLGPNLTYWGLAPIVEEPVKAAALILLFLFVRHEFDGPLDGIVYGALIGFGFSMTENLLFFLKDQQILISQFWIRSVLFGFNHAFFTCIVGLTLGLVRYTPQRIVRYFALACSLCVAIFFHALHNFAVNYDLPGLVFSWLIQSCGVIVILAVAVLAWRHERRWMEDYLREEVALGTITAADYNEAVHIRLRFQAQFTALLSGDWRRFMRVWRMHQAVTKLAFCKHQLSLGDRFRHDDDRESLRREINQLTLQRSQQ